MGFALGFIVGAVVGWFCHVIYSHNKVTASAVVSEAQKVKDSFKS